MIFGGAREKNYRGTPASACKQRRDSDLRWSKVFERRIKVSRKIKSETAIASEWQSIAMRIAQSRTETGRLKMGPFLCSDLATCMVRSVRGRLVFSPCSLSSVGHQGKALSVVSHT